MLSRHVESTSLVASSLPQGSANLASKLKEEKTTWNILEFRLLFELIPLGC